jgi:hypothetical protein
VDDAALQPAPSVGVFLRALDSLRDDMREDIQGLRDEVRLEGDRREDRLMGVMASFARAHAAEHVDDQLVLDRDIGAMKTFMEAAKIAQAKRDGALGVFRFVVELLSKHVRPIVAVIFAVAGAGAVLLGTVHIEVVAR